MGAYPLPAGTRQRCNLEKIDMTINPAQAGFKVNPFKGGSRGELSKQWVTRPADERFLSLDEMFGTLKDRYDRSTTITARNRDITILAPEIEDRSDTHRLAVSVTGEDDVVGNMTHHTFGQISSLAGAPAAYLRTLPSPIVADNLDWGLHVNRTAEKVKAFYETTLDGDVILKAFTGPDYGRIPSHEVVDAVAQVSAGGFWKIPGTMDWRTHIYNPLTPVTKETTTLFGSDKDMFVFLVDDTRPIEVGKLDDGSPDYMFRGFYVTNSEVGAAALRIATFYLRAICCNRIMWGVENFEQINIRHSKGAPDRWLEQARPALQSYAESSSMKLIEGVTKAKEAVLARDEDEALSWLQGRNFSKARAKSIYERVEKEEGRPARTAWDFAQGITAVARDELNTDDRLELEIQAKKILDTVA